MCGKNSGQREMSSNTASGIFGHCSQNPENHTDHPPDNIEYNPMGGGFRFGSCPLQVSFRDHLAHARRVDNGEDSSEQATKRSRQNGTDHVIRNLHVNRSSNGSGRRRHSRGHRDQGQDSTFPVPHEKPTRTVGALEMLAVLHVIGQFQVGSAVGTRNIHGWIGSLKRFRKKSVGYRPAKRDRRSATWIRS